jgi:hypothetical protein
MQHLGVLDRAELIVVRIDGRRIPLRGELSGRPPSDLKS